MPGTTTRRCWTVASSDGRIGSPDPIRSGAQIRYPGIHIAFGNPYGAHTGATWWSSTHIDVVSTEFDVKVDDQWIMRGGRFLIDVS